MNNEKFLREISKKKNVNKIINVKKICKKRIMIKIGVFFVIKERHTQDKIYELTNMTCD